MVDQLTLGGHADSEAYAVLNASSLFVFRKRNVLFQDRRWPMKPTDSSRRSMTTLATKGRDDEPAAVAAQHGFGQAAVRRSRVSSLTCATDPRGLQPSSSSIPAVLAGSGVFFRTPSTSASIWSPMRGFAATFRTRDRLDFQRQTADWQRRSSHRSWDSLVCCRYAGPPMAIKLEHGRQVGMLPHARLSLWPWLSERWC